MSTEIRRVLVTVGGVTVDVEVPAGDSMVRVRMPRAEHETGEVPAPSGLREFAAGLPRQMTYPQKFAAVAFYLREQEGKATVTASELVAACAAAGWGRTKNAKREVELATRYDYLQQLGESRFQLAVKGEALVLHPKS